jgi:hypothetical protein
MARDTRHPNTLLTLIENDKSSQINQTIWRMLRVGATNVFWRTSPTSAIISGWRWVPKK